MTNGARPPAPVGGHSSQVGALLDRAVVPVPDKPTAPVLPDVVLPPVLAAVDPPPPPEVDPVAELPGVVPVAAVVAGPLAAVAAVVVGNLTAP